MAKNIKSEYNSIYEYGPESKYISSQVKSKLISFFNINLGKGYEDKNQRNNSTSK